MDEFFVFVKVQRIEPFFYEVYHGLHVVIGYFLDVYDLLGILYGKVQVYFFQVVKQRMVESL